MSASSAASTTVNDADVENFFRCMGDATTFNATRAQRRRLTDAASQLWRNIVAGRSSGGAAASPIGGSGGSSTNLAAAISAGGGAVATPTSATPVTPQSASDSRFPLPQSASTSSLSSASQGGGGAAATSFRAAKEQGAILALTTNSQTGLLLRPRALGTPVSVAIGKTTLSDTERWKLQAALRREETKASGEKYNQDMLRETKVCKPPTPGEAWPAGRGRPLR